MVIHKCDPDENPLDIPYGGIRAGGGYQANTEYEVGMQRMAEAVHCILGSLHAASKYNTPEDEHISEEIGIVIKVMDEYYKPMYIGRLFTGEYAEMSKDSILSNSMRLEAQVECLKKGLLKHKSEIDTKVFEVARKCYDVLIELSKQASYSVVDDTISNAFASNKLSLEVAVLCQKIENYFKR